eukprot:76928_1
MEMAHQSCLDNFSDFLGDGTNDFVQLLFTIIQKLELNPDLTVEELEAGEGVNGHFVHEENEELSVETMHEEDLAHEDVENIHGRSPKSSGSKHSKRTRSEANISTPLHEKRARRRQRFTQEPPRIEKSNDRGHPRGMGLAKSPRKSVSPRKKSHRSHHHSPRKHSERRRKYSTGADPADLEGTREGRTSRERYRPPSFNRSSRRHRKSPEHFHFDSKPKPSRHRYHPSRSRSRSQSRSRSPADRPGSFSRSRSPLKSYHSRSRSRTPSFSRSRSRSRSPTNADSAKFRSAKIVQPFGFQTELNHVTPAIPKPSFAGVYLTGKQPVPTVAAVSHATQLPVPLVPLGANVFPMRSPMMGLRSAGQTTFRGGFPATRGRGRGGRGRGGRAPTAFNFGRGNFRARGPPPIAGKGDAARFVKNLFVRNIPVDLNRIQVLSSHFEQFGEVVNIQVQKDKNQAFVQFKSHNEAKRALLSPKAVCENRFIEVSWAYYDKQDISETMSALPPNKEQKAQKAAMANVHKLHVQQNGPPKVEKGGKPEVNGRDKLEVATNGEVPKVLQDKIKLMRTKIQEFTVMKRRLSEMKKPNREMEKNAFEKYFRRSNATGPIKATIRNIYFSKICSNFPHSGAFRNRFEDRYGVSRFNEKEERTGAETIRSRHCFRANLPGQRHRLAAVVADTRSGSGQGPWSGRQFQGPRGLSGPGPRSGRLLSGSG